MKMFDAGKTRMTGLPYGEKKNYDDMLSRFHTISACHGQTYGRTDGQNCYINIARQSADARQKWRTKTNTMNCALRQQL